MPICTNRAARMTGPGGGGPSYLIEEDCEDTGTPAAWTDVSGTPNWDDTSPTLPNGGESLNIVRTSGTVYSQAPFTAQDEVWGYFQFNATSFSSGAQIFQLSDGSNNRLARILIEFGSVIRVRAEGGSNVDTVSTVSTATNYHLWWHASNGASDATIEIWFSTGGTKPGTGDDHAISSDGTFTAQLAKIEARVGLANADINYDRILVATEAIGSNP